jgi:hypothetical protein
MTVSLMKEHLVAKQAIAIIELRESAKKNQDPMKVELLEMTDLTATASPEDTIDRIVTTGRRAMRRAHEKVVLREMIVRFSASYRMKENQKEMKDPRTDIAEKGPEPLEVARSLPRGPDEDHASIEDDSVVHS